MSLSKGSLTQQNLLTLQRKEIDLRVPNMPFAMTRVSPAGLWCPCLYWNHFLHDSMSLPDTPCLGKGGITFPTGHSL